MLTIGTTPNHWQRVPDAGYGGTRLLRFEGMAFPDVAYLQGGKVPFCLPMDARPLKGATFLSMAPEEATQNILQWNP